MDNASHFGTLPADIAAVVSAFCVAYLGLVVALSIGFVRYFDGLVVAKRGPKIASVAALVLASVPAALIPLDVFVVSYMKDSTGHLRPWAQDATLRQDVQRTVLYSYYAAYIVVLVTIFLILPMTYFYYDEKAPTTTRISRRVLNAVGMTFVYLFALFVVALAGDLIPPRELPAANSSDWQMIGNVADELETTNWENTLSFVLGVVHLIGMILLAIYVASGMAVAPLKQLYGYPDPREQLAHVVDRRTGVGIEIGEIRRMQHDQPEQAEATTTEQNRLFQLEHEDMNLRAEEEELRQVLSDCLAPVVILTRPMQIVAGIAGAAVGFFLFASLAMSNICRAMNSLGEHWGYLMPTVGVMNLPDHLLFRFQRLFPLDHAVLFIFTCFLAYYAITGIQWIGLGIPKLRTFKIEPWNTKVSSLLVMTMTLVLILSTLVIFYLNLVPQYFHYGSQTYVCSNATSNLPPMLPTPLPDSKLGLLFRKDDSIARCPSEESVVPCDWDAPAEQCVMSRIGVIWSRVFYKFWYFGIVYHWLSWIFLAVVIMEALVTLVRIGRYEVTDSVENDP